MLLELRQFPLLVSDVEVAGPEVDLDGVGLSEFEEVRLGLLGEVEERLGAFEAVLRLHLFRAGALARTELPAVAARSAVAEAVRLDQDHVDAGLGQMRGGRQSGEAAADDHDVRRQVAVQRRIFGTFSDGVFIPGEAGGDGRDVGHDFSGVGEQGNR